MSPDIDTCARLLYRGTDTDIARQLLGIVKVCKASGGDDQCRGKRDPDAFYRGEEFKLPVKNIGYDSLHLLLHVLDLLFKECDGLFK